MKQQKNIVLIHGWGANSSKLGSLAKELENLGWQVYLPKLPGFELKPPDKAWDVGDYLNYVSIKSKKFFKGKNYIVFGHSFGGRVAIKAASYPVKEVSGAVICAAGGLSRGKFIKRGFFFLLAKAGKIFLIAFPLASLWRKTLYKFAGEHDYEKVSGVMKQTFKRVISEDLKPLAGQIRLPTLILWGDQDKLTPVMDAYFLKKSISTSKLKIYNNQGHQLPYQSPGELAKEINKWAHKFF